VTNSLANISGWAAAGRRHGALGLINTDWGDAGHYNLQGGSLLAYAWGAQEAWSGPVAAGEFDRAFDRLLFPGSKGVARLYRRIGDVHELGAPVTNGSALMHVFFEKLGVGETIPHCKPARLESARRKLAALIPRVERALARADVGSLALEEMLFATRASEFAVRKAITGQEYLGWREGTIRPRAAGRKRLAAELRGLAAEQVDLARMLRRLWMARNRRSNLEGNLDRIRASVRALRRGAQRIESGHRPTPGRISPEARSS
jgi:hypothetical protein